MSLSEPSRSIPGLEPGRRAALVVSEMQRGIVGPGVSLLPDLAAHVASRDVVQHLDRLVGAARAHGVLVVWSFIAPRADRIGTSRNSPLLSLLQRWPFSAGTEAVELTAGLTREDQDVVVTRTHGLTPFHGTDLDPILRAEGVETVILTGVSTDVALTGGALEAVNRGYRVVLCTDCTAGSSEESHARRVEEFFPLMGAVTSSDAIIATLEEAP